MKTDPKKQVPPDTESQAQDIAEEAEKPLREIDPVAFRDYFPNGPDQGDRHLKARLAGYLLARVPPDTLNRMHEAVMAEPKADRAQAALEQILDYP